MIESIDETDKMKREQVNQHNWGYGGVWNFDNIKLKS